MTEKNQQDSYGEHTIAWVRALAAISLEGSPLPDAQVLWWKAQALRRRDRERAATAPLDVGEFILLGGGIVAALALFVWLLMMPAVRALPSFVVAVTMSVALLCITAAVAILETTRTSGK